MAICVYMVEFGSTDALLTDLLALLQYAFTNCLNYCVVFELCFVLFKLPSIQTQHIHKAYILTIVYNATWSLSVLKADLEKQVG